MSEHPIDMCREPTCQPCVAQRAFEAARAVQAQQLAENLRIVGDALLAPARWLVARITRRRA